MDLTAFLHNRRPQWRELEAILQRVEGSGLEALDEHQALRFGVLYRSAASDLNQSQTFVRGDATVQYLNDLVSRCYLAIYSRERTDWRKIFRALCLGWPAVFRRHAGPVVLATVIFTLCTIFGYLASALDTQAARAFLLPGEMGMIEPGADGASDRARSTGELAEFSGHLFRNNASVSLTAFALGITFGIGTSWLLWYNGIIMGALAAVFVEAGQFTAFCTGILPHGVLEIPAILISGAAGLVLAQGMIRARPWPRLHELAAAGKEALYLAAGCFPLLVAAAILEAGVARAPDRFIDSGLKLAVAGVFGLLFALYVLLVGWRYASKTS
jgi:uncharacterized membrane protein SpoIIM required for sporulation